METQYRLGKDSVGKDYVVVNERIKSFIHDLRPECEIDSDKYIEANLIQIGRIAEAHMFNEEAIKEILDNIFLFIEIAENYSETKIKIINDLTDKEYQKIFDKIQIVNVHINDDAIINKQAFVSNSISKYVNKHLVNKEEINSYDRIEYQW
ncbi:MAG: hypothetical protein Q4F12_04365 [Erysipelotrichaceae bacterium]|nr:hypothetical protein [Erysipelotrichaceae bacterium]